MHAVPATRAPKETAHPPGENPRPRPVPRAPRPATGGARHARLLVEGHVPVLLPWPHRIRGGAHGVEMDSVVAGCSSPLLDSAHASHHHHTVCNQAFQNSQMRSDLSPLSCSGCRQYTTDDYRE